jgi:hypothetical protein
VKIDDEKITKQSVFVQPTKTREEQKLSTVIDTLSTKTLSSQLNQKNDSFEFKRQQFYIKHGGPPSQASTSFNNSGNNNKFYNNAGKQLRQTSITQFLQITPNSKKLAPQQQQQQHLAGVRQSSRHAQQANERLQKAQSQAQRTTLVGSWQQHGSCLGKHAHLFKHPPPQQQQQQQQQQVFTYLPMFSTVLVLVPPSHHYASDASRAKIAAFDMDQTLINTKSGKKFAQSRSDWVWWHESVPECLRRLREQG